MPDPPPIPAAVLSYAVQPAEGQGEGRWMLCYFLLELPALVIPFVAFTWGVSPLSIFWELAHDIFEGRSFDTDDLTIPSLAFPFFLAFPIAYLGLRLVVWGRASLAELWMAIALAGLAAAGTVRIGLRICPMLVEYSPRDLEWFIFLAAAAVLPAGVIVICIKRRRWPLRTHAMFSLLTAYLANAAFCLIAFKDEVQIGYLVAACVSLVYVAHGVLLVVRRLTW